jgi:hypothetical protein
MADDISVLREAFRREHDPKDRRADGYKNWEYYSVGASRDDIRRLLDEGLVTIVVKTSTLTRYKLTQKGNDVVWAASMEQEMERVPATSILDAMSLIIGYDDIKQTLAGAIEARRKVNFLLEGPPACAKSLLLEAVRSITPRNYMAFGSRTSASGLSDALFEYQPEILLMDEADKMHNDVFSVLLGLMESGEIIETKSQKTRGIKLRTMVIAACNSSAKMPREFRSRFALHVRFPEYTRDEFIAVCCGFLSRAENCPTDIATIIGISVFDNHIGDVRKARGVWLLMNEPTVNEVRRVIQLMIRYSPDSEIKQKKSQQMSQRLL